MSNSKTAKNPIGATDKTLRIIEVLKRRGSGGITELAEELDTTKGTVHNHLSTLRDHEYVVKEGSTYRLSLRFLELGEHTRQQTELFKVAKSEVDALAEETGEIANLMIEEHGRGVYLYIAHGEYAVNLDTDVGTRQYLHTSAVGKAALSKMDESKLQSIIDLHGLPAKTPNTVTSPDKLREELAMIRDRGVAFDGEERAEGICCVAAPITDSDDRLLGSVSVSGPSTRLKGERLQTEVPEQVQNTSTVIGLNASYS